MDVNKRANIAFKKLKKYKKLSKRKQKKKTPIYARRLVTSLFKKLDNTAVPLSLPDTDDPFLTTHSTNSVAFAIAQQYIDAHTELAMHMLTSSLSVSKEVADLNKEFDYLQCMRTLDRILIACDLLTSAIEALYRFAEAPHGIGSYNSMKLLFSKGLVPSSTHVFNLMKNLILAVESAESRVGFLIRSPHEYNTDKAQDLISGEVSVKDQLILRDDFLNDSITSIGNLEMIRNFLLNTIEEYRRLAKGIPESDMEHYDMLVRVATRDLENRQEWHNAKARQEAEAAETGEDTKSASKLDGDHIEL